MDRLIELDKDIFLYFNGLHAAWLDQPMFLMSKTVLWLPLFALLLYQIFNEYRRASWIVLLGIVITITLSDQITTALMKPYFERLRPSHDPGLEGLVHFVNNYRGSSFGFASSHAANTFGAALFLYLLIGKKKKGIVLLFLWAGFVSYTRIYLGVHYPGDILAGAAVGMLVALLMVNITRYGLNKFGAAYPRSNDLSRGSTTS
jgi:undecaprenyl-diphosphatase